MSFSNIIMYIFHQKFNVYMWMFIKSTEPAYKQIACFLEIVIHEYSSAHWQLEEK